MNITPYGDDAFLLTIGGTVRHSAMDLINTVALTLRACEAFTEIVPAYDSVLVQFNPRSIDALQARALIDKAVNAPAKGGISAKGRHHIFPACYEGEFAPDMHSVRQQTGLSQAQIIAAHSERIYTVCFLGFIPGFTFLSQTDECLHVPRKTNPAMRVMPGSIGLAGWQTGIYALESPGGWNIIGRTPQTLFAPNSETPFTLRPGDTLSFKPISSQDFATLQELEL